MNIWQAEYVKIKVGFSILIKASFSALKYFDKSEFQDGEFGGSVGQVCVGPILKVESFQDVAMALMPALLPQEGDTSEESFVPFFPSFP
jgi:hypothetical protein